MDCEVKTLKSKQGFGIMEIVASMVILAFMFLAVMQMHYVNRVAVIRIQNRNEATQIAKQVADSLSALGIASVGPISNLVVTGSSRAVSINTSDTPSYRVNVTVDTIFATEQGGTGYSFDHQISKRINVTVTWDYTTAAPHSISYATVVE